MIIQSCENLWGYDMAATNQYKLDWLTYLYRQCCVCSNSDDLTIHHVENETKDKNTSSNLALMCRICHVNYHKTYQGNASNRQTFIRYLDRHRNFPLVVKKRLVKFREVKNVQINL
jgi:hypothetical protein